MYKQRAKRVGTGKTKEQKRQRYERLMDWSPGGPGKAFAGSKRNKHVKRQGGYTHASQHDWYVLQVSPIEKNNGKHKQFVANAIINGHTEGIVRIDTAQGSKPEHGKRFHKISDCFPDPVKLVGH
jgi:hypothetical protein